MIFKIDPGDHINVRKTASAPVPEKNDRKPLGSVTCTAGKNPDLIGQVTAQARAKLQARKPEINHPGDLLDDSWFLGYIAGLATAAASDADISDEVEVLDLMTSSAGELAGNGLPSKVSAYGKIALAWGEPAFADGSRQGKSDWACRPEKS